MKAYELIEQCGWQQGAYGNSGDGFCIMGVLYEAYEFDIAVGYKCRIKEKVGCMPEIWNDKPERTKAEVIAVLKQMEGVTE